MDCPECGYHGPADYDVTDPRRDEDRDGLVARFRAIIEWVSERDHGRAVELDAVVYGLEQLLEAEVKRVDMLRRGRYFLAPPDE